MWRYSATGVINESRQTGGSRVLHGPGSPRWTLKSQERSSTGMAGALGKMERTAPDGVRLRCSQGEVQEIWLNLNASAGPLRKDGAREGWCSGRMVQVLDAFLGAVRCGSQLCCELERDRPHVAGSSLTSCDRCDASDSRRSSRWHPAGKHPQIAAALNSS